MIWNAWIHEKKRLYGFGCALDVAGSRFAAVLVMIACVMYGDSKKNDWYHVVFYMTCFIIISVIGNMIGRTTTVGMVLGMLVIVYSFFSSGVSTKYIRTVTSLTVVFVTLAIIQT